MVKENSITLYAIRNRSTGKFATNLTNPSHKFWEKRGSCESALATYKRRYYNKAARTYEHKPEEYCKNRLEYDKQTMIEKYGHCDGLE